MASKRIFDLSVIAFFLGGIALMVFILLAPKSCVVDVVDAMAPSEVERAWRDQLPLSLRREPAFMWPKEHAERPDLLILGGERSVAMTVPLRVALAGKMDVFRIPAVPGDDPAEWERLPHWVSVMPWDYLLLIRDSGAAPSPESVDGVVSMLKNLGCPILWVVDAGQLETDKAPAGFAYLASEGVVMLPVGDGDAVEVADGLAQALVSLDEKLNTEAVNH